MKNSLIILMMLLSLTAIAQTNFDLGFAEGYKKGFCHDVGNCGTPIVPKAPLPTVYENSNNYTDGYDRGFKAGLEKQNLEKSNNQNSGTYTTSKPKFIDFTGDSNSSSEISSNEISKMNERYEEMYSYYEIILRRINDDSKITSNQSRYKEIKEKYLSKVSMLMKEFNKNKVTILQNDSKFGDHYMKLLTIVSDFNNEMTDNGF